MDIDLRGSVRLSHKNKKISFCSENYIYETNGYNSDGRIRLNCLVSSRLKTGQMLCLKTGRIVYFQNLVFDLVLSHFSKTP